MLTIFIWLRESNEFIFKSESFKHLWSLTFYAIVNIMSEAAFTIMHCY